MHLLCMILQLKRHQLATSNIYVYDMPGFDVNMMESNSDDVLENFADILNGNIHAGNKV